MRTKRLLISLALGLAATLLWMLWGQISLAALLVSGLFSIVILLENWTSLMSHLRLWLTLDWIIERIDPHGFLFDLTIP